MSGGEAPAPARSRYARDAGLHASAAEAWSLETVCPAAALYGANGIRIGPDGRLWICEGSGGRISACDPATGELETVVPMGSPIIAPDDLAFGADGTLYVTSASQVAGRRPDGEYFVLLDDVPHANGITIDAQDRLYVTEFRPAGRLLEVTLPDAGTLRVVAEGLDLPNACEKGPDGRIYLQNVLAGTVSAIDIDSGERELIADGLKRVSSVKFDPRGRVVAAQADIGEVTAIDLLSGERELLARMPYDTIDNFCFDADGALYVSNYATGGVIRVRAADAPHGVTLVPHGLVNPATIAPLGASLLVANLVSVVLVDPSGPFEVWSPWSPLSAETMARGAWPIDVETAWVLTGGGSVLRTRRGQTIADVLDGAEGARQAVAPPAAQGASAICGRDEALLVAIADAGEIRTIGPDGTVIDRAATSQSNIAALAASAHALASADPDAGSVVVLAGAERHTITGFERPTAVALAGDWVLVAEHGARRVTRCRFDGSERQTLASSLAFGSPLPGASSRTMASLLAAADGSILIGCDGDGSILRLAPA